MTTSTTGSNEKQQQSYATSKYAGHTPDLRLSDESPLLIMTGLDRMAGSVSHYPGTWAYVEGREEAEANARLWADSPAILAQRDELATLLERALLLVSHELEGINESIGSHSCGHPDAQCDGQCVERAAMSDLYHDIRIALAKVGAAHA